MLKRVLLGFVRGARDKRLGELWGVGSEALRGERDEPRNGLRLALLGVLLGTEI